MIYGYIRVSTDKQTVENQRFEISKFVQNKKMAIDLWIEETISGTISPEKRNLGKLLSQLKAGDILICSEISRLGRTMFMIMSILNELMEKGVVIYKVKEGYTLGEDLTSKVLAFAFSISAEIERTLISQRTKEALQRKINEGIHVGHPIGKKNSHYKLSGKEDEIRQKLNDGFSKNYLIKYYGVSSATFYSFLRNSKIYIPD